MATPEFFDAERVAQALPYTRLMAALTATFSAGAEAPPRATLNIGGTDDVMLLMPAWRPGHLATVKIATVYPGNGPRGLSTVQGVVCAFDGRNGRPLALLDATELTRRRTAAASGLAASYLARTDSAVLTVVGTGALALHLASAHLAARPMLRTIRFWGRDPGKARTAAQTLGAVAPTLTIESVEDLAAAVGDSDIVSCATASPQPLLRGTWVRPGTHVDLVGSFKPDRREADSDLIAAARVFVDTYPGFEHEAGDVLIPIAEGRISRQHVLGDFVSLISGTVTGRRESTDITVFKSVGSAIEDLAACDLVLRTFGIV